MQQKKIFAIQNMLIEKQEAIKRKKGKIRNDRGKQN